MALIDQVITKDYALYNGDCVEVVSGLPGKSIGMSVYSPPFCGLYNYSSDDRDMSNSLTYECIRFAKTCRPLPSLRSQVVKYFVASIVPIGNE